MAYGVATPVVRFQGCIQAPNGAITPYAAEAVETPPPPPFRRRRAVRTATRRRCRGHVHRVGGVCALASAGSVGLAPATGPRRERGAGGATDRRLPSRPCPDRRGREQ